MEKKDECRQMPSITISRESFFIEMNWTFKWQMAHPFHSEMCAESEIDPNTDLWLLNIYGSFHAGVSKVVALRSPILMKFTGGGGFVYMRIDNSQNILEPLGILAILDQYKVWGLAP